MSSPGKPRRLLPLAMVAGLAAGGATAVVAAGAGGGNRITIAGDPGAKITVIGSQHDDAITYGGFTGGVTIGANRAVTSLRRDCDVNEASPNTGFCSRNGSDYSKLETRLGDGPDHAEFYDSFDPPGFRILVSGGRGGDTLIGTEGPDELSGGRGDDNLSGLEDDDDLDGGAGVDACDGGDGNNRIRHCES